MTVTKNSFPKSIAFGLISVALAATIIWILAQIQTASTRSGLNTNQPTSSQADLLVNPTPTPKMTEVFYWAEVKNGITRLYRQILDGEKKLIYTDSDEKLKTLKALGLSQGQILIYEGDPLQPEYGKISSLSLDGRAEKKIINNDFFSTSLPTLSPDGQKITSLSFSNAEADFGFTLFVQNLDGSNRQIIQKAETNFISPAFNHDQDKLAYIINQGEVGSLIEISDLKAGNIEPVHTAKDIVTDLAWQNDNLIASISPPGVATANSAELWKIDVATKKLTKITANQNYEGNLFSFNEDQDTIYIEQNLTQGILDQGAAGKIKSLSGKHNFGDAPGNYVFGWNNE